MPNFPLPFRTAIAAPFVAFSLVVPAWSGISCSIETLDCQTTRVEGRKVIYRWQGEVKQRGDGPTQVGVRLVARDRSGNPVAYLDLPPIDLQPGRAVRQEATFEVDQSVWSRVYTIDNETRSLGEEDG